jgi:tetrahydromethanopterin S-methyltransferase subunit G
MEEKIKSLPDEPSAEALEIDEQESEEQLLEHAILHLNGNILGIVLGIVLGLTIFLATNWLVIKGGSDAGTHLRLLNQFFIGYSVTFVGSLVGLFYGFLTGYIIGFLIAWIYNRIVIFKGHRDS